MSAPTEYEVQQFLWLYKSASYAVMLPNYEPVDWHECDMFAVTKAGYFHEFEIKLSASDFRADAEKSAKDQWKNVDGNFERIAGKRKHLRLNDGDAHGPSRFYYVIPQSIIEPCGPLKMREIPNWAGLIVFSGGGRTPIRYRMEGRTAPKIHGQKVNRAVFRHSINVCYWRFWKERNKNEVLKRALESAPDSKPSRRSLYKPAITQTNPAYPTNNAPNIDGRGGEESKRLKTPAAPALAPSPDNANELAGESSASGAGLESALDSKCPARHLSLSSGGAN